MGGKRGNRRTGSLEAPITHRKVIGMATDYVHLLPTVAGPEDTLCGVYSENSSPEINDVTCPDCYEEHEKLIQEQDSD